MARRKARPITDAEIQDLILDQEEGRAPADDWDAINGLIAKIKELREDIRLEYGQALARTVNERDWLQDEVNRLRLLVPAEESLDDFMARTGGPDGGGGGY